jgi:helicase required for RNAi-mediated heterochromatin assembly 1
VQAKSEIEPPSYVQNDPYTDMSSIVTMEECQNFENVNILQDWPSSNSHGLDNSQSRALRRILTKRLAIVQGPPGTGKTYVSVIALKILLSNMRKDDPPIIVTCQTNHALDQLLRHVAEFEPNFIRLGGRSKDTDKIKKRTLYEVRSSVSQTKSNGSLMGQAIASMKQLTKEMQMLLAPLEANKPPLDHRVLVKLGIITEVRTVTQCSLWPPKSCKDHCAKDSSALRDCLDPPVRIPELG